MAAAAAAASAEAVDDAWDGARFDETCEVPANAVSERDRDMTDDDAADADADAAKNDFQHMCDAVDTTVTAKAVVVPADGAAERWDDVREWTEGG